MRRIRGGSTDRELAWDRRAIAVAIGVSLLAHVGFLSWLILTKPRSFASRPQESWTSLQMVPPFDARPRSRKSTPKARASRPLTAAPPRAPPAPLPSAPSILAAAPPRGRAPVPDAASAARLSAALRTSVIGCASLDPSDAGEAQRRHCQEALAKRLADAPDYAGFALTAEKRAAFDAAAKRALWFQQPFLADKPKNGCRPLVKHQDVAVLGGSREDYSAALACGKTF